MAQFFGPWVQSLQEALKARDLKGNRFAPHATARTRKPDYGRQFAFRSA